MMTRGWGETVTDTRVHFPASTHHNGDDGDGGHKVVPVDLCPLDADQDLGAGQVEDGHFLVQTPS